MKFTTLSLVATLALSSAYAGGDITPIEAPVAVAPAESATTIAGKLTAYYITDDSTDDFLVTKVNWLLELHSMYLTNFLHGLLQTRLF